MVAKLVVAVDGRTAFKHQRVIDRILQVLLRPKASFGGQDRLMPQQKLNLLQLAALRVIEVLPQFRSRGSHETLASIGLVKVRSRLDQISGA